MTADQKAEASLQPKVLSEPNLDGLDDRHRAVLNIIAENSPCTEPKLFITAINSELECFGGISLGDLRERLGQCVQNLKESGLVKTVANEFVLADTACAEADDGLDQFSETQQRAHSVDEVPLDEVPLDEVPLDETPADETPADRGHSEEESLSDGRQASAAETDTARSAPEPPTEDVAASLPEGGDDADILDLTGELELELVPDDPEEAPADRGYADEEPIAEAEDVAGAPEPTRDKGDPIESGPSESADDGDVLDLTGELELELVLDVPEEASTDQDRAEEEPPAGDPPERDDTQQVGEPTREDGEPTREEIVAAMRLFVSEDGPENEQDQKGAMPKKPGQTDT